MNIHFVREKVTYGQVRLLHVSLGYQIADIITNGLPRQFDDFQHILFENTFDIFLTSDNLQFRL